jgi:ubiquinone/menaquinone biosynthesis C-methylase UbiE
LKYGLPEGDLRKYYRELYGSVFTKVDIVDDGEKLSNIKDSTLDFVIASHFLEHCQNPIGTIYNIFRVLKGNGIIYMVIPDKRYTFDIDRPTTTFEHLVSDYLDGPESSRSIHIEEFNNLFEKDNYKEDFGNLHYHIWTQFEMFELLNRLKKEFSFKYDMEFFAKNNDECIFVLRKN